MLGAGNVSTHISRHLHSKGHRISCIYSSNLESASLLADEFGAKATTQQEEVPRQADFYLVCVPDQAVSSVLSLFKGWKGTWLHTAGALNLDLFKGLQSRYGVLYPLQTLSKTQDISLASTPFLVEGSSAEVTESISGLAASISAHVQEIDSESRLTIHLAAVFANNFTNHMVHIGQQILSEHKLDIKLLEPILEETVRKIGVMGAGDAQTGPALRNDQLSMQKHLDLLKSHPEWEKLYTFISRDIGYTRVQKPHSGNDQF
jgi:predicted short-subunit dehydrogenase-like oxidoreductase (DUF2520 family)